MVELRNRKTSENIVRSPSTVHTIASILSVINLASGNKPNLLDPRSFSPLEPQLSLKDSIAKPLEPWYQGLQNRTFYMFQDSDLPASRLT